MKVNEIPLSLYASQDIKTLESLAIEKNHIPAYQLMCRAGQAALNVLLENWPQVSSIEVCCGPGNNGGDGFVVARLAKAMGLTVKLYQIGKNTSNISTQAQQAQADWIAIGGEILEFKGQIFSGEIIVDALLGTGARVPMPLEFQNIIAAINQSPHPVLAIDLPSGLNADTGSFEQVVKASVTITFIGMKLGLVVGPSIDVVGRLHFDNLGIPASLYPEVKPKALRLDFNETMKALPLRSLSSHKGNYGHVCVIGGGQIGYSGAVCLAGEAALRGGAGLVSAVVAPESLPLLARAPAELMSYGFSHAKDLTPLLAKATFIVLGPGLSQAKWGEEFFHATLKTSKPLLVDADGLNWLARFPQRRDTWILTPHPGEAGRLLGKSTNEIQQDRVNAALILQEKYGGVVVLKGAGTIIVDEQRKIYINVGGFPALATGGTGDVLSGLIGSLGAQGLTLSQAAQIGVCVHANAAQLEQSLGERGMLASDLFLHIRSLLNPAGSSE